MAKTVYIVATSVRNSRSTVWGGTVEELANDVFGYTLECGNSWNPGVNCNPKTLKSLISNLDKASAASCRCYQDTYYREATPEEIELFKANVNPDSRIQSYTL